MGLSRPGIECWILCLLNVSGPTSMTGQSGWCTWLSAIMPYFVITETRIRIGWNKFRQLVPLLTNKDTTLKTRGRLYGSCVRNGILYGSETWPIRKEHEMALQRAEMRTVRWIYGIKLQERVPNKGLRQRLGLDDIISVQQQNRLQWCGACAAKRRQWLSEEMCGVWSGGCQAKRFTKENLDRDCGKRLSGM